MTRRDPSTPEPRREDLKEEIPMSDQSARVALLQRRLLTCEAARRRAARTGDNRLASDLANINRELILDARAEDIRSLAIVWLLHLGATADLTATLAPTSAPVAVTGTFSGTR